MNGISPSPRPVSGAARSSTKRRQSGRSESAVAQRNLCESPLGWLARRKGRDGKPMVNEVQLAAGERLRSEFTRAGLTPQVTSRWSTLPRGGGAGGPEAFTDMVLAAKQRMSAALAAVGPELSGILLDVCCFLKGLEQVESERHWPARTAKVVLCLALDRLAGHYGWSITASGPARTQMRAWQADAEAGQAEET